MEAPQRETTCSRPHVAAAAELYRNLHAVRRWQTHVARLEDYGVEEGKGVDRVVEGEEEGERGRRAMIGGEEEATPPSSPGHAHPGGGAQDGEGQGQGEESEEAREAREARQRAADRVAVVRALTPGATLCLRLSARYPGWVHFVRHASITVRFMRDE